MKIPFLLCFIARDCALMVSCFWCKQLAKMATKMSRPVNPSMKIRIPLLRMLFHRMVNLHPTTIRIQPPTSKTQKNHLLGTLDESVLRNHLKKLKSPLQSQLSKMFLLQSNLNLLILSRIMRRLPTIRCWKLSFCHSKYNMCLIVYVVFFWHINFNLIYRALHENLVIFYLIQNLLYLFSARWFYGARATVFCGWDYNP